MIRILLIALLLAVPQLEAGGISFEKQTSRSLNLFSQPGMRLELVAGAGFARVGGELRRPDSPGRLRDLETRTAWPFSLGLRADFPLLFSDRLDRNILLFGELRYRHLDKSWNTSGISREFRLGGLFANGGLMVRFGGLPNSPEKPYPLGRDARTEDGSPRSPAVP